MWERPSPLAGYFHHLRQPQRRRHLRHRVAGLPLTRSASRCSLSTTSRAPANRLYPGGSLNGSTWEARHQLASVNYLMHAPFALFAVWLGAGSVVVARRLFGK